MASSGKMNAIRPRLGALLFAGAAMLATTSTLATSQIPTDTVTTPRKTTLDLPNSPPELWSRILTMLKNNGGFTPRQTVEEILGIRFTHTEEDDEKRKPRLGAQFLHTFKEEIPGVGLLHVVLFDDPKKTFLTVAWGPERAELPDCLDLGQVTHDLNLLGWQPGTRTPEPGLGAQKFFKEEDWVEQRKTGKAFNLNTGISMLVLGMPNQFSQCVNSITARIWRP